MTYEPVMSVAEVVALERRIADEGTPLYELMTRAGAAVADAVRELAPEPCPVVVFVGLGNNGGDGWIAAKLLAEAGYGVKLVALRGGRGIMVDPARQAALDVEVWCLDNPGLEVIVGPGDAMLNAILADANIIIDAILGTGFSGAEIREPFATWVKAANTRRVFSKGTCKTVAVDVPSGLSADAGTAARPCVVADLTVTMLAYKPGLVSEQAASWVGELRLADLRPEQTPVQMKEPKNPHGSFALFKRLKEKMAQAQSDVQSDMGR